MGICFFFSKRKWRRRRGWESQSVNSLQGNPLATATPRTAGVLREENLWIRDSRLGEEVTWTGKDR